MQHLATCLPVIMIAWFVVLSVSALALGQAWAFPLLGFVPYGDPSSGMWIAGSMMDLFNAYNPF